MTFSEQITEPELREELESREQKLDEAIAEQPVLPEISRIEGGILRENVLGRARIRADGSMVCPASGRFYRVAVHYKKLPRAPLRIETTPSRLVRVGDHWHEAGFEADWRRQWELPDPGSPTKSVSFLIPRRTITLDRPRVQPGTKRGPGYHIPPLSTRIRGDGTLIYWTGHQREVATRAQEGQILGRPAADGSLQARPGGIYATFYGDTQPEVKLGNSWIPAPPIS
jgi:hypothetical protein